MAYFQKVKSNNKQGYKWVCVIEAPPDPVTGKRRQIARRGDTKKEALARAEEALEKLTEYEIDEKKAKHMPFEKVAWEWYDIYSKTGVKKNTLRIRKIEINAILKYFSKINIDKITSRMYQKMLNDMHEIGYAVKGENGETIYKPYSRTTISGVHTTANMIFKYAVQHKLRKDNPCEGAVIPKKSVTVEEIEKTPIEEKYMERHELEEFLKTVDEHGLYLDREWFYLLAFSGMRSGEMLALKWSDIDFERNEIRITKTLFNPRENMRMYELETPKTKGSIRTIEMDPKIMDMLKQHKINQAKLRLQMPLDMEYHDADFVFCRENGYPFVQGNVNRRMARLLKMTSIKKHLTPHSFRHTHISMLAEAGIDLPTIMKRVGHEDQETTMKIYTHVTEKMKKDAMRKMKSEFGNLLENL